MKVLSRVFRGKFTAGLKKAFRKRQLSFPGALQPLAQEAAFRSFLRSLFRQDWVVYAKPPFGGPQHVLRLAVQHAFGVVCASHKSDLRSHHNLALRHRRSYRALNEACADPAVPRPTTCGALTLNAPEYVLLCVDPSIPKIPNINVLNCLKLKEITLPRQAEFLELMGVDALPVS